MNRVKLSPASIELQTASLIALAAVATVTRGMRVVARPSAADPTRPRHMLCHSSLGNRRSSARYDQQEEWEYCALLPMTDHHDQRRR